VRPAHDENQAIDLADGDAARRHEPGRIFGASTLLSEALLSGKSVTRVKLENAHCF